MPWLQVFMEADGMLKDTPADKLIHITEAIKVGVLSGGMESGRPAVAIGITLPDGRTVLAETSLRLFLLAAKAFAGRYGWQDEEDKPVIGEGINRKKPGPN